jgi:hypothetical protein
MMGMLYLLFSPAESPGSVEFWSAGLVQTLFHRLSKMAAAFRLTDVFLTNDATLAWADVVHGFNCTL